MDVSYDCNRGWLEMRDGEERKKSRVYRDATNQGSRLDVQLVRLDGGGCVAGVFNLYHRCVGMLVLCT